MTTYYGHIERDRRERLDTHLGNVAELAATFASRFDSAEWGRLAGLWHDVGKYSDAFQTYIRSSAGNYYGRDARTVRVDHSTGGAQHAISQCGTAGKLLAYCIAGHHGGLPDSVDPDGGESGLECRLAKAVPPFDNAPEGLLAQVCPGFPRLELHSSAAERAFQAAFFCRMLFSCLVDADFLATEEFMAPERATVRPKRQPGVAELLAVLDQYLERKQASSPNTPVNRRRSEVLEACRDAASRRPGVFSLTVPTGGGKTLSSLAFALAHADRHGLRRVIVAIPFTSIIEQNADVFRDALAPLGECSVLEVHSNLEPQHTTLWSRLASENWDAPLIVTTNVQLYESLFANRPSRCRKLHRIAESVIVLDEAQTLPVELLRPSLAALEELCHNYGCSVVLCSATQPAVAKRDDFPIGLPAVSEVYPDPPRLFSALRRTTTENIGNLSDEALAERLARHDQVLCIVNTRRHAAHLYELLVSIGEAGCLHLSAQMCARHRSAVLRLVRQRLRRQEPCRVVSTQIVEAGVDIDFPVVYRAMAGLDSIIQAAGRCNREGGLERGRVFVFETDTRPTHWVAQAAQDTREVYRDHRELSDPAAIEEYFRLHYWKRRDAWDQYNVMACFSMTQDGLHAQFRQAANRYRIIRDEQMPVLVPYSRRGRLLVEALTRMDRPPGREFDRRVQRYIVNVHEQSYRRLLESQAATIRHERFCVLENLAAYDRRLGLRVDVSGFDPSGLII